MTIGPHLELQGAMVAILRANDDLKALIGDPIRLYQDVPATTTYPYITIGEGQNIPALAECIDGSEIYSDFHVWSISSGFSECKRITATIWAALNGASLTLVENTCLLLERDGERYLRDPDGTTKHGVLTLRALVDPL